MILYFHIKLILKIIFSLPKNFPNAESQCWKPSGQLVSSKGLESRAAGQPAFVLPGMAGGDIVYLIMEITKEFGSLKGVFLGQQICLQIPFLENNPGVAVTASLTALTHNVKNTGDH